MAGSYKKLWKLLIDKDMKKKDLCAKAGIISSITKMGRNGHVITEVLLKICTALDCRILILRKDKGGLHYGKQIYICGNQWSGR